MLKIVNTQGVLQELSVRQRNKALRRLLSQQTYKTRDREIFYYLAPWQKYLAYNTELRLGISAIHVNRVTDRYVK
jgi:hypothetical protein